MSRADSKHDVGAAQCALQIRRTVTHLSRSLRPRLQRTGLSTAKLSVIGQLNRRDQKAGGITPTELAALEGVKIQTLTRLLAELENDGWLIREAHPSDGRQSLLTLTTQGRKSLADAFKTSDAALAKVIQSTVGAHDQLLLLRACELLARLDEAVSEQIDSL